jgi:hypothetical protein
MDTSSLILEYVKTLAWPLTTFIIVLLFRRQLTSILSRIRKADLPGGISVETFPDEISQAKQLAKDVRQEKPPDVERRTVPAIPLTEANTRMMNLGLSPSPSGLEISHYRTLAQEDPVLALAGLRIELETMLKNLAKGFKVKISERDSASVITHKLLDCRAITSTQAELVKSIIRLANAAVHGIKVTREQAEEILDTATILRDQYVDWLSWGFLGDKK